MRRQKPADLAKMTDGARVGLISRPQISIIEVMDNEDVGSGFHAMF